MQKVYFIRLFESRRALFKVVVFFLFCIPYMKAQDTIVKRNNERIAAKIIAVNPEDIKYKRSDYADGPLFALHKWELKFIVYGNGVKESFESIQSESAKNDLIIQPSGNVYYFQRSRIEEQRMLDIAWKLKDRRINLIINRTEQKKVIKNWFLFSGLALDFAGLLTYVGAFSPSPGATVGKAAARQARKAIAAQNHTTGGYIILGGLSCELVSFIFHVQESRNAHMVADLYNNSVSQ